MRRRARVDENQREIMHVLRQIGAVVQPLHAVGDGCPDLLVGFRGRTWLIECKGEASMKRHPHTDGRTPEQVRWHRKWMGGPVYVVRSPAEAVDCVS